MHKRDVGSHALHLPKSLDMSLVFDEACRELLKPYPSMRLPDWDLFNQVTGGLRPREFSILCGATGCLGGDAIISINRAGKGFKISIRDLYQRSNGIGLWNDNFDPGIQTYVRSYDGIRTRLHPIQNVVLSGVKETWRLKADQGRTIRLTPCHRVLTERGWVAARDLRADEDRLAMDCDRPKKSGRVRAKLRDTYFGGVKYHPYSTKANSRRRIVKHRAVFEAKLNNLSLDDFLNICRIDRSKASTLRFVNPKTHHVHHKDHNHYNNDPNNLELLAIEDHLREHGDVNNFNAGTIQWVTFRGFDRVGVEAVYDIECEDPHHNFVADGLIVHNSGKTTWLANVSVQLLKAKVKHFVMSVETGHTDFMKRILSVFTATDLNALDSVSQGFVDNMGEKYAEQIHNGLIQFSIYDNRVALPQLIHDLEFMHKAGCKVAMIDNLNFFMEVSTAANSIIEMDRVVHELIMLCKRIDMHIIMVMHPKKTDHGRVESEFDIKGSSTAVQEAHNVFLFNRPKEITDDNRYDRELLFAKMRRRGKMVGKSITYGSVNTKYIERSLSGII